MLQGKLRQRALAIEEPADRRQLELEGIRLLGWLAVQRGPTPKPETIPELLNGTGADTKS